MSIRSGPATRTDGPPAGDGSTVAFGDEKALRKKIIGIKMDSRSPQEPKPDADQNLAIQLLKLVAPAEIADALLPAKLAVGDGDQERVHAIVIEPMRHFLVDPCGRVGVTRYNSLVCNSRAWLSY